MEGTQLVGTEFETPTLVVHSRTRTARSGVQPVDPLEATQVRRSLFYHFELFFEQLQGLKKSINFTCPLGKHYPRYSCTTIKFYLTKDIF